MADINFEAPEYYTNRELSWLDFNYRILGEARDKENKGRAFFKVAAFIIPPQNTLTLNKPFKSIFHPKHFDAPIKVAIFVPKYTFSYTIVQIWQHSPHYTNIGYSHLMM